MSAYPHNNSAGSIQVERDGIKLGWNLLVMIASLGVGLYVASIIAPIKLAQENMTSRLLTLESIVTAQSKKNAEVRERLIVLEQYQLYVRPYQKEQLD